MIEKADTMASKKNDVKFKYVNVIPNNVDAGTFYWKYENNVNQLYFSPTERGKDVMRLDNIISGQGVAVGPSISLVGIYPAPPQDEQVTIDQESRTVNAWSDADWESYVRALTETEKYGNISDKPFMMGNVVICGNREFVCKASEMRFRTVTVVGVEYFRSRKTGGPCVDNEGNMIEYSRDVVPDDADVEQYISILWECFGENLSKELADKIANFNMSINGGVTINVEENEMVEGGTSYTLSVIIKEHNPLAVSRNSNDDKEVSVSELNTDDPTGGQTLMSAKQVKDVLNEAINMEWIERESI